MACLLLLITLASPVVAVSGTDFSNNLFSDLAPLIALFGEQVSKQFLSQSLGFADAILFAMAPLGIITGVVSAIRLSGYTWLKAIVGRISETRGAAGLELTAATSSDICELWDGRSAVRIMGKPAILSVVFAKDDLLMRETYRPELRMLEAEERALMSGPDDSDSDSDSDAEYDEEFPPNESSEIVAPKGSLLSFDEAKAKGWFRGHLNLLQPRPKPRGGQSNLTSQDEDSRPPPHENPPKPPNPIPPIPPNLSLNIRQRPKRSWVKMAAAVSVLVQSTVIILAALFTFYIPKDISESKHYAFALLVSGTTLMCSGITICALRVSWSSKQEYWRPTKLKDSETKVRLVWLQKKQTVNDETYPSCALEPRQEEILLSYTDESQQNQHDKLVLLGVTLSLIGFILQFVGLRYMYWAVSVVQLGAMIVNTLLRVFIQLPLSTPSKAHQLREKFELEWVVSEIYEKMEWHPRAATEMRPGNVRNNDQDANSAKMLQCRIQLASMAREIGWELHYLDEAMLIKNAIDAFLNCMWQWEIDLTPSAVATKELRWPFDIAGDAAPETQRFDFVYLSASRERHPGGWSKWSTDLTEIEAFLSLWLFHMKSKSPELGSEDKSTKSEPEADETNLDASLEEFLWAVSPTGAISSIDFDFWVRRSNHSFVVQDDLPLKPELASTWLKSDSTRGIRSPMCEICLSGFSILHLKPLLTMAGYSTVPRICGRYILANIIRHSFKLVQKASQPASFRPGSNNSESTSMETESIRSMSDCIAQTELMNQQEALALIIPALRERELLPNPPLPSLAVDEHAFPHAELHASLRLAHAHMLDQSYRLALRTYTEILELGETMPQSLLEMVTALKEGATFVAQARNLAEKHNHYFPCGEKGCSFAKSFTVPEQRLFVESLCVQKVTVCSTRSFLEADIVADHVQFSSARLYDTYQRAESWRLYYLLTTSLTIKDLEEFLYLCATHDNMTFMALFLMTISSNPEYKKTRLCLPALLDHAVKNQNHEMVKLMLYYTHRPIVMLQGSPNALQTAVDIDDLTGLGLMIDSGVPIDSRTPQGCTILQYAAAHDKIEAVKSLVSMGASVEAPVAPKTQSALASAIYNQNQQMAVYLLKHGAEPNPPLRWYGTPLSLAKRKGDESLIQVLLDNGSRPSDIANQMEGRMFVDADVRSARPRVVKLPVSPLGLGSIADDDDNDWSSVRRFRSRQSSEEPDDKLEIFPWSALQIAAAKGNEAEVASLILTEDPKQPAGALQGRTALQAAAESGQDGVVAMLMPLVDINQARAEIGGLTALEAASRNGYLEIVHRLLAGGADPKAQAGSEGGTALQLACRHGHMDIVKLLIEQGAPVDASGADVGGFTAVAAAKLNGNDEMISLLVANGAVEDE